MNAPTNQRAHPDDEALNQYGSAFKGAMAAIRRLRGRDTHRPGELSFAQYHLLSGLANCDELPARALSLAADESQATVAQMLDGLAEMGLIERDLAGVVDQVGERVAKLAVGDEVLGTALTARLPSRHSPIRSSSSSSWCTLPANGAGKRTLIRVLTTLLDQ
jgi:hypothetical protein